MSYDFSGVDGGPSANAQTIERCRREIDHPAKRVARSILLPFIKAHLKLESVGEGFQWGLPLHLPPGAVRAGRYSYIGAHCTANGPVLIGDLCMISSHVKIPGNDHRIDVVGGATRLEFANHDRPVTVLEADCWIGQGAIIREGVRIGRGAVIAAGAVVTSSVEPYQIVGGSPARVIRTRFSPEQIALHDKMLFG